ncbi:Uncharacterised protein [Serratia fonticola]|uniref:hypothetical protein n=1 Tax=Serratia fonticola TaxID=47917 RepID=UPI002184057C|nr:hypothetical protein [Serratia fonticola]CAI2158521.1 Uncharacterised protein [Serratia fonticola]
MKILFFLNHAKFSIKGSVWLCFMALWSMVPQAYSETAQTTVTAIVKATCTVSFDRATVKMGDIPYTAAMDDPSNKGNLIPGAKSEAITLTGDCTGQAKFKYTLKPSDWERFGGCIDPSPKAMIYLCIFNGNTKMDFKDAKLPTITNQNNGTLTLQIKPAYGERPKAGTYTATLEVNIEPM